MRNLDFYDALTVMLLGFHIAGAGDVSWFAVLIPFLFKYLVALPFGAVLKVAKAAALDAQKEKALRDKVLR